MVLSAGDGLKIFNSAGTQKNQEMVKTYYGDSLQSPAGLRESTRRHTEAGSSFLLAGASVIAHLFCVVHLTDAVLETQQH